MTSQAGTCNSSISEVFGVLRECTSGRDFCWDNTPNTDIDDQPVIWTSTGANLTDWGRLALGGSWPWESWGRRTSPTSLPSLSASLGELQILGVDPGDWLESSQLSQIQLKFLLRVPGGHRHLIKQARQVKQLTRRRDLAAAPAQAHRFRPPGRNLSIVQGP